MRIPAIILLFFENLLFLAIVAAFFSPVFLFLGYIDFPIDYWFMLVGGSIALAVLYNLLYLRYTSNKTKKDLCFLRWSYQRFIYPRIFKPKLLIGEQIIIPETPCFFRVVSSIVRNQHVALVSITSKRVIIDGFTPPDPNSLSKKIVLWYSDSPPKPIGLSETLWKLSSFDITDYEVSFGEDDAGRYVKIIQSGLLGRSEYFIYHPNSRKLYEILKVAEKE